MKNNCSIAVLCAALAFAGPRFAHASGNVQLPPPPQAPLQPCTSVIVDAPTQIVLGKSTVVRLSRPARRMVVGGLSSGQAGKPDDTASATRAPGAPGQATAAAGSSGVAAVDLMLLSPTELFFIGKRAGSMNVVLQGEDGNCLVKDLVVTIDPDTLQAKLAELMPEETGIRVRGAENALVLTGNVRDAVALDHVMTLATSYGDGKKVVNMLRVTAPQQVMLEVAIAEVSKTLLDKLGARFEVTHNTGENTFGLLSNFLSSGGGLLTALRPFKGRLDIDAEKDDGVVRVLAEPAIIAISGQSASFLSGGKIFLPVSQVNNLGIATITLEEKEFGIGVKFTPTVLENSRINLKLVTEVSDLSQTGSPFTTVGGVSAVFPSFSVRRADTTVQLNDGQSLLIAGLIKNGSSTAIKRLPGLGEVGILGALFRSTEFQTDQTELLFVITPRLVKPLEKAPRLPTENHVLPSRSEILLEGRLEGSAPASAAPVRVEGSVSAPAVPVRVEGPVSTPAVPVPMDVSAPAPAAPGRVEPASAPALAPPARVEAAPAPDAAPARVEAASAPNAAPARVEAASAPDAAPARVEAASAPDAAPARVEAASAPDPAPAHVEAASAPALAPPARVEAASAPDPAPAHVEAAPAPDAAAARVAAASAPDAAAVRVEEASSPAPAAQDQLNESVQVPPDQDRVGSFLEPSPG